MTRQQAVKLATFIVEWMRATVPGLQAVRVTENTVTVRDALGWRAVGPTTDYAQVARALGKL